MLDSLVRVSRRVGWKADKLAPDPEREAQASPTGLRERSPGTVAQSPAVELPEKER